MKAKKRPFARPLGRAALAAAVTVALGVVSSSAGAGVSATTPVSSQYLGSGLLGTSTTATTTTTLDTVLATDPANGQRAPEAVDRFTNQVIPNGSVLLVWTGDNIVDDGVADSDFVAVLDTEPRSKTYGQVIWTAALPSYVGSNNPGSLLGHTSDVHNEPHHGNTYTQYVDKVTGQKFLFTGGLISGNMFRFDITDPRAIPRADLVICGNELTISSLTDDIFTMPAVNGRVHMIATYMSGKSYGGPGALVEFDPHRKATCAGGLPYDPVVLSNEDQFLREWKAAKTGGPKRYVPNPVTGNTDSGLEAYPHGMWFTPDGSHVVTSDYAMAASIGGGDPIQNVFNSTFLNSPLSTNDSSIRMFGTTVRVWDVKHLDQGPINISQVPDGPRHEDVYFHEEPEGLMPFGLPHQRGHYDATGTFVPHQGAFVGSMCGGTMFYTSNIMADHVKWNAVWDVGPCTGVSVFTISANDKFLVFPVAGIQAPGDPEYNRDYAGEHDRREVVLDIRPLLRKGTAAVNCDFPLAAPTRRANTSLGLPEDPTNSKDMVHHLIHNNGAADCPIKVAEVVHNTPLNYADRGGAHYTLIDRVGASSVPAQHRVVWSDYFVKLDHMGLQGTGSGGDRKIYLANFDPETGAMSLDTSFRDELTGEVGVAFGSDARGTYYWPNRGVTGKARPHAMTLERKGAVVKDTWDADYDPAAAGVDVHNY